MNTLRTLFYHFALKDRDESRILMETLLHSILSLAVRIWRFVFCKFMIWPYQNVLLTDAKQSVREETSQKFYNVSECCLDPSFSRKLRRIGVNAALLLTNLAVMAALRLWARYGQIGNMICERLLALFKRSSVLRCAIERAISGGYLAQLLHAHLNAGGSDLRKLTRKQLIELGVPLRARSARTKKHRCS